MKIQFIQMKVKACISAMLAFILFLTFSAASLNAQNNINATDSATFADAPWSIKKIEPGITLKQVHFTKNELFNTNLFISIVEIEADYGKKIEIVPSPVLIETPVLAQKNDAIAAVNGSFFKFNYEHNTVDYNSVDYIRKDNTNLAPNTYTSANRSMHQKGALAIYNGELYILLADKVKDWEKYIQAEEIITTGPALRIDSKDVTLANSSFYTTRHPRTAIAKKDNGNVLFVTVDGRAKESAGMSLKELQSTLRWMGASYIINLDGGGSTTMYVKDASDNGVVNHPSDNKKFDNNGARKVANIIIVK